MIRGTTPTIIFNLPMRMDFDVLYITFNQRATTVLEKTLADVTIDGTQIVLPLSQSDTLAFDSDSGVKIQFRAKIGSMAYASSVINTSVSDILKEGEI